MLKPYIGTHDLLFITFDTLRYDVAHQAWLEGLTPGLARILPAGGWEKRHSPASFTYAAHHAFFAGFLPTPTQPGRHARLFAAHFLGSETTDENSFVFEAPDLPHGLAAEGYHTLCIGGVGFFNKQTALGRVLPDLFAESHWNETLGVTSVTSTEHQVALAIRQLSARPPEERLFLFLNLSALHQPNCLFHESVQTDSAGTQKAALAYVDRHVPKLLQAMTARAPVFGIFCSDHGTAYGEAGYHGHRLAHQTVWDVPYAHRVFAQGAFL